jgi:hypothetical protein
MRPNPGILATHYARKLIDTANVSTWFSAREHYKPDGIDISFRRCTICHKPSGGAVVTVEVRDAGYNRPKCAIRLRAGWTEREVADAISRAWEKTYDKWRVWKRARDAEARFDTDSDALIQKADAFASTIGWDGCYDTLTEDQALAFHTWMDEQGIPRKDVPCHATTE